MKITKGYLKQVIMEELQKEVEGGGGYHDLTVHNGITGKHYNGGEVVIKPGSYKITFNRNNDNKTLAVYTQPTDEGYAAGKYVADLTPQQLKQENDRNNVYLGVSGQQTLGIREGFFGNLFGGGKKDGGTQLDNAIKNLPNIIKHIQSESASGRVNPKYSQMLRDIYSTVNNASKSLANSGKSKFVPSLLQNINALMGTVNTLSTKASFEQQKQAKATLQGVSGTIQQLIQQVSSVK